MQAKTKLIDEKILSLIQQYGVLTRKEIEEKLGYKDMLRRLRRMVREGKIKIMRIQRINYQPLKKYFQKNLYYIDDDGIRKWVRKKIRSVKIRMRLLKSLGLLSKQSCSVGINEDLYGELKTIARRRGMSLRQLVEMILMERLDEKA